MKTIGIKGIHTKTAYLRADNSLKTVYWENTLHVLDSVHTLVSELVDSYTAAHTRLSI